MTPVIFHQEHPSHILHPQHDTRRSSLAGGSSATAAMEEQRKRRFGSDGDLRGRSLVSTGSRGFDTSAVHDRGEERLLSPNRRGGKAIVGKSGFLKG